MTRRATWAVAPGVTTNVGSTSSVISSSSVSGRRSTVTATLPELTTLTVCRPDDDPRDRSGDSSTECSLRAMISAATVAVALPHSEVSSTAGWRSPAATWGPTSMLTGMSKIWFDSIAAVSTSSATNSARSPDGWRFTTCGASSLLCSRNVNVVGAPGTSWIDSGMNLAVTGIVGERYLPGRSAVDCVGAESPRRDQR